MYEKYAGKRESEFYSATILLGHWIDLRLTFFLFFVDVVDALTNERHYRESGRGV